MLLTKNSVFSFKEKKKHHCFFLLSNCPQVLTIFYD